ADFTLEIVVYPALDVFGAAGHADDTLATVANFSPNRAAVTGAMHDPVRDAAQRDHRAWEKWRRLRQPAETGGDPAAVTLRKVLGVGDGAARRHGEDRLAIARMDAQRVAPRAPVTAKPDRIDLGAVLDQKTGRFVRPPIKERASGHVC